VSGAYISETHRVEQPGAPVACFGCEGPAGAAGSHRINMSDGRALALCPGCGKAACWPPFSLRRQVEVAAEHSLTVPELMRQYGGSLELAGRLMEGVDEALDAYKAGEPEGALEAAGMKRTAAARRRRRRLEAERPHTGGTVRGLESQNTQRDDRPGSSETQRALACGRSPAPAA
jgi:hypothetical protein